MVKRHVDGKRPRDICQRTPNPDLGSCAGLFAVGSRLTAGTTKKAEILGISSGGHPASCSPVR
jgi:hypothetical protein